jgi:AraC-like DNA-binding protein
MAAAAQKIGADPTRLARSFVDAFGIAPHTYVMGRRIDAARERILGGQRLADVAADVGFFDQAHLTRRFIAFLGVSPGHYRRQTTPRHWRLAPPSVSGGSGQVTAGG